MSPGNHSPLPRSPTNHESFDRIRKRVRKACDRCRLKKTKCDGSSPCLRCRTDNVICCSVDGQKMRRRNFPKGYAEMLEKQHNQLVCGLQELYRRLQKGSLWEGEPLDESTGRPLAHDILAALNILQPKSDGADETEVFGDFVEQPESSSTRDESSDAGNITPKGHRREMRRDSKRQKSLDPPAFIDSDSSTQNVASGNPSQAFPNNVTGTEHSPEQLNFWQQIFPRPSLESAMSLQGQLDTPSSSLVPSYDTRAASSQRSSLKPRDWNLQVPAVLQPLMTQTPGLYGDNSSSSHRMDLSASRPPFSQGWFGDGVGFDSSDFMSDFHHLSPQGPAGIDLLKLEKIKGWT